MAVASIYVPTFGIGIGIGIFNDNVCGVCPFFFACTFIAIRLNQRALRRSCFGSCVDLSALVSFLCAHKSSMYLNTLEEEEDKNACPKEPCHVPVAFMGDSLTRFMYYSLVYYLRWGAWIDPASRPNLVRPKDFLTGREMKSFWHPGTMPAPPPSRRLKAVTVTASRMQNPR